MLRWFRGPLTLCALVLPWGPGVAQEGRMVTIYKDVPGPGEPDRRSQPERLFLPYGLMPGEKARQIAVNHKCLRDMKDPKTGTCVEVLFHLKQLDEWLGTYVLINGNAWGTKPGINVQELLRAEPTEKIALRFEARGKGVVTFKCGGVGDGPHKSSLAIARELDDSPIKLPADWREFTIGPIEAGLLTNCVDPLCIVASALDNRKLGVVEVYVDNIRFEPYVKPRKREMPINWKQRLTNTLFVCYTPTGFDPTTSPISRPTDEDIRKDLHAVRQLAALAGIPPAQVGVITYGCSQSLERIPEIVKETGLVMILGIFNARDPVEVTNAITILQRENLEESILGVCVGNENLLFRRARMEDIRDVVTRLQAVRPIPVTTTEPVHDYGRKGMFDFHFSLVNAHALFAGVHKHDQAAKWATDQAEALLELAPETHPVLIKEFGWPAGPAPEFTEELQAEYWRTILKSDVARKVNVCIFEAFDTVKWKSETVTLPGNKKVDIGPHWPVLFGPDRKAKPFAIELLRLWKQTR